MEIHQYSGQEIRQLRLQKNLSQTEFWAKFETTQSGGSRYESGRAIPQPVQVLLNLALAPKAQASAMLDTLRGVQSKKR